MLTLFALLLLLNSQDPAAGAGTTVARFDAALEAGDSATVLALLAPDAVILESGGIETRAQYRTEHLPADIEFARATTRTARAPTITVRGDVAWVVSVDRVTGTFRGRSIDADGATLMVLVRGDQGWRIAAVHWSSRARRS